MNKKEKLIEKIAELAYGEDVASQYTKWGDLDFEARYPWYSVAKAIQPLIEAEVKAADKSGYERAMKWCAEKIETDRDVSKLMTGL